MRRETVGGLVHGGLVAYGGLLLADYHGRLPWQTTSETNDH